MFEGDTALSPLESDRDVPYGPARDGGVVASRSTFRPRRAWQGAAYKSVGGTAPPPAIDADVPYGHLCYCVVAGLTARERPPSYYAAVAYNSAVPAALPRLPNGGVEGGCGFHTGTLLRDR